MDESPPDVDVLIIGAGPAGTVTAALLADAGLSVRILEKSHFPRFVIGESLLPSVMNCLDAAGLVDVLRSRGYQHKPGAIFYKNGESTHIDFADSQFTEAWDHTWHVDRADFDLTLANAVQERGVDIRFGEEVTNVDMSALVVNSRNDSGDPSAHRARFVVDASGYGRVLARLLELDAPSNEPPRVAVFGHVRGDERPSGPDEGKIWICVGENTWSWFIPLADGRTSVGAITDPETWESLDGDDEARLRTLISREEHAGERLAPANLIAPPKSMTAWSRSITSLHGANFCLVGNATEFVDPVLSSGIALALGGAQRAADLIVRQLSGEDVDWDAEYEEPMRAGSNVFREFVHAWYDGTFADILFAARQPERFKQQITSILAGYVWDDDNPFAGDAGRRLRRLARKIQQIERLGL